MWRHASYLNTKRDRWVSGGWWQVVEPLPGFYPTARVPTLPTNLPGHDF